MLKESLVNILIINKKLFKAKNKSNRKLNNKRIIISK